MVTREQLRDYRSKVEELRKLRARMRSAELAAMESERESDRRYAETMAQLYDAQIAECEEEMMQIQAGIANLGSARLRETVRLRYVDGKSLVEIARIQHCDERTVKRCLQEAERLMAGE